MAAFALVAASCSKNNEAGKEPIAKPQITIEGGRLTPEGLWAMGRISEVSFDDKTSELTYHVRYYSVSENRSTDWTRVCKLENDQLTLIREFVTPDDPEEAEGRLKSPDGKHELAIKTIKVGERTVDKYADLPKASGKIVTDLMYKHWDEWVEEAPHPFIDGIDILAGTEYESPMRPFGGLEQFAWSPDSKVLAYTCRKKTGLEYAISTNSDIYLYDLETKEHKNITAPNGGYDINPAFSPDGSKIAWLSMERDGYESDWNRLFIMDLRTGEKTQLAKTLDTNVDEFYWEDDNHIVFNACWHACVGLYRVELATDEWELVLGGQYDYEPVATVGGKLLCLRHSMREANEIFLGETQLTHENDNIYDQIERSTVVPRWQKTSDGKQMLTWIIYPPHFDPSKKYPTLLYCEGGPQSPVSQFWSFRWNFMMMTAGDYIVVAPNRRGLSGFGLEWNEQISGDYGGQCMRDYFTAIDEFVANEPYVDKDHLGCVGASFGGFSVYWIAGHHDGRFKAFIAHDGIFNMEMQYLETEEKWFANWDMGGAYWEKDNKIAQRTFANSPHLFVDKWDTPILCIHGEKDYRILANQAMAAFDAAKMRGVPAELLIFPDENHWVLKPQNGILWQREFRAWLDKWLK